MDTAWFDLGTDLPPDRVIRRCFFRTKDGVEQVIQVESAAGKDLSDNELKLYRLECLGIEDDGAELLGVQLVINSPDTGA